MSENGPYNQPPQNPYGGGDGTGGQPPYGPPQGNPYGDAATGGQPGYGQGPYPGAPGPDQGMYAGGQPPYGPGPGGPVGPVGPGGYPPAQPPQGGGGSKAGLWVVIGGGVVIVVLVIAVVVMLVTNGNDGGEIASGPDESSEVVEEEPAEEEPVEEETPASNGALGDPPHALPTEPCEAFTDQVQTDFVLRDSGSKYVSDNTSSCSNLGDLPDSSPTEGFGSLEVGFKLPYSASDSPEAASEDIEYTLERVRGGAESDRYDADDVEVDEELEIGSEAYLVITKTDLLGDKLPEASLLLRQDNLIISVTYYLDTTSGDHEDLALPDNTQDIMVNAANEALAIVGG
ncbi:DUF3558 domain-containing protein [Nocardiopsis eucommiae]|uniref:DUF3558 domain-containing protein n=1 Tax=Nocardiopsis eucommiae TaxID=2831970 RepID=UPI003D744792